ncbi:MAG: ABC transporter ATP-binding protein [Campylobacteraceae bacterium]
MSIEIRDVSKTFDVQKGFTLALKKTSLTINDGEFICLIGPSGCGKTTLLNMLAGFFPPTTGEIYIDEQKVTKPNNKRITIFQDYGLFPWKSALENVAFGLECQNIPKKEAKEEARKYLKLVGLNGDAEKSISSLSGGMKQRVSIARALAVKPSVLFMDEPFGALDAFTRFKLQEELLKICKTSKPTIVFVTHDIDEAVFLADKVVIMAPSPGRVESIVPIKIPHPRNRTSKEYEKARHDIYEIFKNLHDI